MTKKGALCLKVAADGTVTRFYIRNDRENKAIRNDRALSVAYAVLLLPLMLMFIVNSMRPHYPYEPSSI